MLAFAGLLGWAVALPLHLGLSCGLVDRDGDAFGGDFISFYTAGRLVLEGRAAQLYDLALQQRTQSEVLEAPGYRALCSFVNPPVVAAVLAPLALLPYRVAYALFTALMFGAFLLALRLLRPYLPTMQRHWLTVVGLSFLFYPVSVTITGGQNTAVTLLLLAATYVYLRRGREVRAGLTLGLLFYKPQFALLLLALLLARRQLRCVSAAAALGVAHYLAGAALCGPAWPLEMSRTLAVYWPLENAYNGMTSISLIGFCEAALPGSTGRPVGLALAALTGLLVLWAWRRADPRAPSFARHWAAAVCATILVSPHTQWYDVGLVVLPVLLALNDALEGGISLSPGGRLALVAGFLLVPFYRWADALGWQPVILLPLLTLAWVLRRRITPRTDLRPSALAGQRAA